MHRIPILAAIAVLVLGCTQTPESQPRRPQQAGKPLDPVSTAARIAAIRGSALVGDQEATREHFTALHKDLMRSMKVADATRPIDREAARAAARQVEGVRSVAWVDRYNLLALVDRNELRSQQTIDDICLQLEPLGDTLAVVVHLQSAVARNGDELETISRNCQLAVGDQALGQRNRQLDVIPPEVRQVHRANNARPVDAAESKRRADEAMRVLEATTPEM